MTRKKHLINQIVSINFNKDPTKSIKITMKPQKIVMRKTQTNKMRLLDFLKSRDLRGLSLIINYNKEK